MVGAETTIGSGSRLERRAGRRERQGRRNNRSLRSPQSREPPAPPTATTESLDAPCQASTADQIARVDTSNQIERRARAAGPPPGRALAGGDRRARQVRAARRPGGAPVAARLRHGRQRGRRRSRARRARRPPHAPDDDRARLRASVLGDSRLGRALLELLGRHRGDACLLRRRGRARRDAGRGDDGRTARRAGARRRRARDRPAVRSPAARRRRLHDRLRPRGRRRRRRDGAHAHRDRRLRRSRGGAGAASGGPTAASDSLAWQIAEQAQDACVCIYGAGPTAAAAYRWKCQINENSKLPAFAAELPEADHNEIVGWEGAAVAGKFLAVFLEDSDQHPRTRQRIELTRELIEPQAAGHDRSSRAAATARSPA